MNTYYELIKHLKTVFEEDVNVNTVTTEDRLEVIDSYKKNVYPLVHLNVIDSPYLDGGLACTRFTVEVICVDIRDINKQEQDDKFWLNDNRHDNLNTTRAVLKKAENKLRKDHLNTDITLAGASGAEALVLVFSNLLDGWQQTFLIDVPDELTTVC